VFLERYPFCFGYWKKYADIMKRRKMPSENILAIFERGVVAIALSVDLWIHFLNYLMNNLHKERTTEGMAAVRTVFERAIDACGLEFKSDKLWDMYVNWETENQEYARVTAVYERLFTTPTQQYQQHFEKFKEHIREHGVQACVTTEEFQGHLKSLSDEDLYNENAPPGEQKISEVAATQTIELPPTATKMIQDRIIDQRAQVFKTLEKEIAKISAYEEQIRRNYFHVKPLEKSQLENWKSYLDFLVQNYSQEKIIFLFERCVITCCYYEEYWLKYCHYLEDANLIEKAQEVMRRAGDIHLPGKISFHTEWANFEEKHVGCIYLTSRLAG
jgi:pre-mRNA-processing factor 39